ncbi:MAG: hypothetical protein COU98_01335 [Candidatus Staskawiczbacteria bacterium CG10_big_fil_rev_8_21_14_0_10_38_10]|uniref:OmpA-like domain-containing protein n=1 Tax=Candidatus Staskawiczbacteria bacterium CG10_big_fil_rev_8_21_14_0_10_38_10 TaxID=1974891 RepID=A0A2H9T1K4_9BACT|nr:MAG: hypothetical protein COU98_01335 [Candidatus Staskawiczbacteria bacterium CG10_big_fil_rev_8_21_14_0_10_38_10]
MPNIELHGYVDGEAQNLRKAIFELFKDEQFVGEMVVTIVNSQVRDAKGRSQPFIRVASTRATYIRKLLKKLKTLGEDIEHLKLEAFYPKSG